MKSDTLIRFSWNTVIGYFSYDCEKSIEFLKAWYLQYTMKHLDLVVKMYKNKDCWLEHPAEFFISGATANEKCIKFVLKKCSFSEIILINVFIPKY